MSSHIETLKSICVMCKRENTESCASACQCGYVLPESHECLVCRKKFYKYPGESLYCRQCAQHGIDICNCGQHYLSKQSKICTICQRSYDNYNDRCANCKRRTSNEAICGHCEEIPICKLIHSIPMQDGLRLRVIYRVMRQEHDGCGYCSDADMDECSIKVFEETKVFPVPTMLQVNEENQIQLDNAILLKYYTIKPQNCHMGPTYIIKSVNVINQNLIDPKESI